METHITHKPVFLPEGIASPDGRTGYVAAEARGIDAIDLNIHRSTDGGKTADFISG
jgi:hypothetical protein